MLPEHKMFAKRYTYQKAMVQPKNNSTHLLKLNGRVLRMTLGSSLLRGLLYTGTNCPKKVWRYILHGFLYQGNAWLMMWVMARATLRMFVAMHFMSPCSDVSMEHTDVEAWVETMSWRENGGRVTNARNLASMLTGANWSAMCYWGKYCHTFP